MVAGLSLCLIQLCQLRPSARRKASLDAGFRCARPVNGRKYQKVWAVGDQVQVALCRRGGTAGVTP